MIEEEPTAAGVPEWVLTFGDMMSLLLTFFIMLVSMSETKQNERFQAMLESIRRQFGHQISRDSLIPGELRPRNSMLASLASMGRSRRMDILKGGAKIRAPVGENSRVQMIRLGPKTGIGAVVLFAESSTDLDDTAENVLRQLADEISGKPQKIELRGHTSFRPLPGNSEFADQFELGFARVRATLRFLVDDLKIPEERCRLAVAGPYEPAQIESGKAPHNARVEVFLLEEFTSDLQGDDVSRQQRTVEIPSP